MVRPYPSPSTLGAIIRRQRELAELPMRQLAAAVGISNPYLSQIERGLRAPSDAVLNAIADSLETTADALYAQAGFVPVPHPDEESPLQVAIDSATELTRAQRQVLSEVYRAFRDANAVRRSRDADRLAAAHADTTRVGGTPSADTPPADASLDDPSLDDPSLADASLADASLDDAGLGGR